MTSLLQFQARLVRCIAPAFSPQHNRVDERLRFLFGDMAQRNDKLVKLRIDTRTTDWLELWLRVERHCDTCIELFLSLSYKLSAKSAPQTERLGAAAYGSEEHMKRVFSDSLLIFLVMLRRLRMMVGLFSPWFPALHALDFSLSGSVGTRIDDGRGPLRHNGP
jgi:hypothetical protein